MQSRFAELRPRWLLIFSRFAGSPTGWLVVLLSIFAWAPLTYPGYFEFHSGFLPVFNLNDLTYHLTDPSLYSGQVLAWAPMVGQAYDLWRGERELPYVLALLPRTLGAPSVAAVKWVFGASILLGALGTYGWTRRRLGMWPGLVAAAVCVFWPLGLATVYVRGAFAEAVFLGLMPWVLWAADAAVKGQPGAGIGLGMALAAAFWTQAGLALWLAGMMLAYILVVTRRYHSPLGWVGGLVLGGLGLVPLILHHGWGSGTWVNFADHFVYLHQLLLAGWGTGPSIPGPDDTLTFQLGLVACGLAVFSIAGRGLVKPRIPRTHAVRFPVAESGKGQEAKGEGQSRVSPGLAARAGKIPYLSLAFVLLLSFLSTTLSAPLWKLVPFLARTLTYPWQLLLLTGPWLAWLAGLGGRRLLELLPTELTDKPVQHNTATSTSPLDEAPGTTPITVALSAALIALALLGSYDYLRPLTTNAPVPDAPLAIFGDNQIALLSAVTAGPPGPGGRVTALVRWQALRPLDQDYTVFFHVIGPDGKRWGQQDTMPQGNQLPTSRWRPGQVVMDQYQVFLAADAPISEDYRYLLGLYLWQTGQRLTTGADDKVVLQP